MFDGAARRKIKRFRPSRNWRRDGGAFLFHRAKVSGELIKIILAPLLVWMIVAAGALEPRPEEHLAEHRGALRRIPAVAVDHRRSVTMVGAFGEEDFAYELIVRLVLPEALPEPLIQRENALDTYAVRIRSHQVGPLCGPVIRVSRIFQHAGDELPALVRCGIGQKLPDLFGRRQHTD